MGLFDRQAAPPPPDADALLRLEVAMETTGRNWYSSGQPSGACVTSQLLKPWLWESAKDGSFYFAGPIFHLGTDELTARATATILLFGRIMAIQPEMRTLLLKNAWLSANDAIREKRSLELPTVMFDAEASVYCFWPWPLKNRGQLHKPSLFTADLKFRGNYGIVLEMGCSTREIRVLGPSAALIAVHTTAEALRRHNPIAERAWLLLLSVTCDRLTQWGFESPWQGLPVESAALDQALIGMANLSEETQRLLT